MTCGGVPGNPGNPPSLRACVAIWVTFGPKNIQHTCRRPRMVVERRQSVQCLPLPGRFCGAGYPRYARMSVRFGEAQIEVLGPGYTTRAKALPLV